MGDVDDCLSDAYRKYSRNPTELKTALNNCMANTFYPSQVECNKYTEGIRRGVYGGTCIPVEHPEFKPLIDNYQNKKGPSDSVYIGNNMYCSIPRVDHQKDPNYLSINCVSGPANRDFGFSVYQLQF
jgi:hypothetical protein